MITLIEAQNYCCLRHIKQTLGNFHVLVGPNASGKTTFLDVISFLGRMLSNGLEAAVTERATNFKDLVWLRQSDWFELAAESAISEKCKAQLKYPFESFHLFDSARRNLLWGICLKMNPSFLCPYGSNEC